MSEKAVIYCPKCRGTMIALENDICLKCKRCGDPEFRIDGFCSVACKEIIEAVETEREACAQIADTFHSYNISGHDPACALCIAEAIRRRGE